MKILRICLTVLIVASLCTVAFATEGDGPFPDTGAPKLYNPEEEENSKATAPDLDRQLQPGNLVENIEEYEELVERAERSSIFDGIMVIAGGLMFFYAALLILAYGLDKVSIFPNISLLKFITFGRYDIYGITVGQFILRDCALLAAGILLGSGIAKKLFTMVLILVQRIVR